LRHGRSTSNTSGVLAGRSPGSSSTTPGRAGLGVAQRLKPVPIAAVVTSPMQRCQQTVAPLLAGRALTAQVEEQLAEVEYGEWTGRELKTCSRNAVRVVQQHPSAAVFPGGEGWPRCRPGRGRDPGARRESDRRARSHRGVVACSHGDVIKSIRPTPWAAPRFVPAIVVDPCSISVVHYTETRRS